MSTRSSGEGLEALAVSAVGPDSRIGALARRLAALVTHRVQEGLADEGITDVRPTHLRVFAAIEQGPVRITQIAERLGSTKQTVGPLVDELVRLGYLSRLPDPQDARAKIVDFTPSGLAAATTAQRCADALDRDLTAQIGLQRAEHCRSALWELITSLE
ncbi:MarR family winged helix-turn-helix transcriptional regulator [Actinomadura rupiterrae]|uniref:MarR family winged helix-turn-helix transcriptional regulator n=1 Tax=Actinomadura rupiterrae TaxID=559627 RepID=UPI0020A2DF1A|nr:MarR family transcriptional regulator [Actinomadura rupiterrae]MCP2342088.1 DNA-binding MarR family transcriptional regulator [Actinomadura rupiterrae]